ncbi:MAG TPA: hypothetical protein VJ327_05940 [Patescibacteria group bacterium]|nr:hypothetical protein [Patescibacteria group bacterium]
MKDIETRAYKDVIEPLLQKHGLSKDSFMIVDDVEKWCLDHGIIKELEYRPFRVAKCLYSSSENKYLILMAQLITADMMTSTNPVVAMRLGTEYADKLYDPNLFIRHTVLHEIGHTKGLSEEDSDSFAFNEMSNYGETQQQAEADGSLGVELECPQLNLSVRRTEI